MATNFWRKLSQETGLHFEDKRIFGWVDGYHVTFTMVLGMMFRFQVYLPANQALGQEADQEALQKSALLRAEAVRVLEAAAKEYKLNRTASLTGEQFAAIEFRTTNKAIKQMGQFIRRAVAGIAGLGIPSVKACSHCGQIMESGEVPVRIKDDVFPMHDNCAEEAIRQQAWLGEPKKGSLPLGILGAAAAAILGAIPWAVVFAMGYMASLVGILIGFMVSRGYDLTHGRQGRVKIVIVLLFVLLSVALGQVAGGSYQLSEYYDEVQSELKSYEEMMYTKTEALVFYWTEDLWASPQAMQEELGNFGTGVFFALLGCSGMFMQMARDTAAKKPKRLYVSM